MGGLHRRWQANRRSCVRLLWEWPKTCVPNEAVLSPWWRTFFEFIHVSLGDSQFKDVQLVHAPPDFHNPGLRQDEGTIVPGLGPRDTNLLLCWCLLRVLHHGYRGDLERVKHRSGQVPALPDQRTREDCAEASVAARARTWQCNRCTCMQRPQLATLKQGQNFMHCDKAGRV